MFEWTLMKRLIWIKAAVISGAASLYETVTGAIVSFVALHAKALKKLVVNIEPVQDLHGYDAPWPAGGGVNILPPFSGFTNNGLTTVVNSDGSITVSGQAEGSGGYITDFVNLAKTVPANATYVFSTMVNPPSQLRIFYDTGVADIGANQNYLIDSKSYDLTKARLYLFTTAGTDYNFTIYPQMMIGSTVPDKFYTYSNECPISGWTGTKVYATGANAWDEEWELGAFNTKTGAAIVANDQIRCRNNIPIVAGEGYRVVTPTGIWMMFLDAEGNPVAPPSGYYGKSENSIQVGGVYSDGFYAPNNSKYIKFYCQKSYGATYNHDISINYPYSDQTYHAYSGDVTQISWQDEAGTVYGAKVTVKQDGSVDMVVDKAAIVKNTATMDNNEDFPGWRNSGIKALVGQGLNNNISGAFSNISPDTGLTFSIAANTVGNNDTLLLIKSYFNKSQNDWIALAKDIQIVVPLAEPVTYHLDNISQISTVVGVNNIFATTGDVSATYYAA